MNSVESRTEGESCQNDVQFITHHSWEMKKCFRFIQRWKEQICFLLCCRCNIIQYTIEPEAKCFVQFKIWPTYTLQINTMNHYNDCFNGMMNSVVEWIVRAESKENGNLCECLYVCNIYFDWINDVKIAVSVLINGSESRKVTYVATLRFTSIEAKCTKFYLIKEIYTHLLWLQCFRATEMTWNANACHFGNWTKRRKVASYSCTEHWMFTMWRTFVKMFSNRTLEVVSATHRILNVLVRI